MTPAKALLMAVLADPCGHAFQEHQVLSSNYLLFGLQSRYGSRLEMLLLFRSSPIHATIPLLGI